MLEVILQSVYSSEFNMIFCLACARYNLISGQKRSCQKYKLRLLIRSGFDESNEAQLIAGFIESHLLLQLAGHGAENSRRGTFWRYIDMAAKDIIAAGEFPDIGAAPHENDLIVRTE